MQRIELKVFKSFFQKELTGKEIDFIVALSHLQDIRGEVFGLHYKDVMQEAGMSAQSFYDCKKSLQEKGIIQVREGIFDYDITLIGNDFSIYTGEDYQSGKVSYVKTNCKMFSDRNWKKLKPAQKLLAMDLLNISKASSGRTHRIGREKFIKKYANTVNADGTEQRGLLNISPRTLQKYMKMLKLYFYIGMKDGMYLITLRSHFAEEIVQNENDVTYKHVLAAACRRHRIAGDSREAAGILNLLCNNRDKLARAAVYIPDIFKRMLEVINQRRADKRKWKRYLKASLFNKLLQDEFLTA